jgi:DNA polymerase III delta' subunit
MIGNKGEETGKFLWEVCGHEKIVGYLKSSILSSKISHAYIFGGQKHLGKNTVAERFIKTLYCQKQDSYRPCGECSACRQVESGSHPDVYRLKKIINDKTGKWRQEIIIDQIRDLKYRLSQGTLLKSWKVALIDEAETLNENAANSLLKVLEEPTAQTVIILIASDVSRLPKTVLSRCQVLNFLAVSKGSIKDFLLSREISSDRAEKISRLALGRPGIAINLTESGEYLDETKKQSEVFFRLLMSNLSVRLKELETLLDFEKDEALNSLKLARLLENWQLALRDVILLKNYNEANLASIRTNKETGELRQITWNDILKLDSLINEAKNLMASNISSKNILENLIINF